MLDGTGRDPPKFNLHVCDEDETKMAVYNMEECIEKEETEKEVGLRRKPCKTKN